MNKKKWVVLLGILIIITLPLIYLILTDYYPKIPQNPNFRRGMTYVTFSTESLLKEKEYENVDEMLSLGVEWVSVIPIWHQNNYSSNEIFSEHEETPTDKGVRKFIRYLHDNNKKVMLKPYVDALDDTWRAKFQPTNLSAWFDSYRDFLWYYSEIAEDENVELYSIGCEYKFIDEENYGNWSKTIKGVRDRYSGDLIYAADYTNYQDICFWDLLDYIGIDAYFPLYDGPNPELSDLIDGWNEALDEVENWLEESFDDDMEIIFTEIGYESQPKCWKSPGFTGSDDTDIEAQDLCYKALFATAPAREWLGGLFFWWWDNPTTHDDGGGEDDNGWTPKGKPAETTLSIYYNYIANRDIYIYYWLILILFSIGVIFVIIIRKRRQN